MKSFQVLLCLCILGLVTLAHSQGDLGEDNLAVPASNFGKRMRIVRIQKRILPRSITTEESSDDKKVPTDYTAAEQQYYIEPVQPTTSTIRPTFRRRKTSRPIASTFAQQNKQEEPTAPDGRGDEGNPEQIANTSFAKHRPSFGGRTRSRAQNNEVSSTTEGQDQRPKIRFTVSKEIDHNDEQNNPSAFGLRGQTFGEPEENEEKTTSFQRKSFRPSSSSSPQQGNGRPGRRQFQKNVDITYESENAPVSPGPNERDGKKKFILRPRTQVSTPANAPDVETSARPLRKRKRPSFLKEEKTNDNSPVVFAPPESKRITDDVPRARSIDGGFRRRKTTSFSPPTQKAVASEIYIENLPSASALVAASGGNRRRPAKRPSILDLISAGSTPITTVVTTDSSMYTSTLPTDVVTEVDFIVLSEPLAIEPPPSPKPKYVPGRDRINERLRHSRGRIPIANTQTEIDSNEPILISGPSPSPNSVAAAEKDANKGLFFPNRNNIFHKLNRKQSAVKMTTAKNIKAEKPTEATKGIEANSEPPRKITSLTQQNLRRRRPAGLAAGILNKKLQKEITSEPPPAPHEEGENISVLSEENDANKTAIAGEPLVENPEVPVATVGLRNNRRRVPAKSSILAAPSKTRLDKKTQSDSEKKSNQSGEVESEGDGPSTPVSKIRRLPTRTPLQRNRLVVSSTTAAPAAGDEVTHEACAPNQRYSKFLKRCVTQYNPKSLGIHPKS